VICLFLAMQPEYKIAAVTEDDVDEIATLVNSAYRGESARAGWTNEGHLLDGERTNAAILSEELQTPGLTILCLRESDGNQLLGCVSLTFKQDSSGLDCYLGMLTIRPTLQNAKLGQKLMAESEKFAAHAGAKRVWLGVIQLRTELLAWYIRRGYQPTGETKPFPEDRVRFPRLTNDPMHFVLLHKQL
jgi:ribosomal protein S18 acetylase RimI-like enzyme